MLKVAIFNVLKKNWLLVVAILIVSAVFQYWREHSVSPLMLFLVLLSSIAAASRRAPGRTSQTT